MQVIKFHNINKKELKNIAVNLQKKLKLGDKVYISGGLGAGKTQFIREFIHSAGYTGVVKSPSYSIVDIYEFNNKKIAHLDLFRLTSGSEFEDAGLDEYLTSKWLTLIEWPEMAKKILPKCEILINIKFSNDQTRRDLVIQNFIPKKLNLSSKL